MGALQLAGAIGGFGKGMVENVEAQRKQDIIDAESQRMEKMQQLGFAHADTSQQTGIQAQKDLQGSENKARADLQGTEIAAADTRENKSIAGRAAVAKLETEARTAQSAAERTSQEKIASGHDTSRERSATIRASATLNSKKQQSRWAFQKGTRQTIGPNGPTSTPMTIINDRQTGRSYTQVGDRFMMTDPDGNALVPDPKGGPDQKVDPSALRRAHPSEVAKLLQNPGQVDNFFDQYHYLPNQWFSSAQNPQAQSGGAGISVSGPAYAFGPNIAPTRSDEPDNEPDNDSDTDSDD